MTLSVYSSKVFSVRGFSTAHPMPSPGSARGLSCCFPALAFHEVTAKEDMLGSHDGRTHQDCHLVTDKQCTILNKEKHHSSRRIFVDLCWILSSSSVD